MAKKGYSDVRLSKAKVFFKQYAERILDPKFQEQGFSRGTRSKGFSINWVKNFNNSEAKFILELVNIDDVDRSTARLFNVPRLSFYSSFGIRYFALENNSNLSTYYGWHLYHFLSYSGGMIYLPVTPDELDMEKKMKRLAKTLGRQVFSWFDLLQNPASALDYIENRIEKKRKELKQDTEMEDEYYIAAYLAKEAGDIKKSGNYSKTAQTITEIKFQEMADLFSP